MRFNNYKFVMIAAVVLGGLSACSSAKDTLGLSRQSPDEFKVLKRAPLSMPPDYALRPPVVGAPRPQEQASAQKAAQTVFGGAPAQAAQPTTSSELLLQQAGTNNANPNIRNVLNEEMEELNEEEKPVAKKLLGISGFGSEAPTRVVDPAKEAERLKENSKAGKPITAGETPTLKD